MAEQARTNDSEMYNIRLPEAGVRQVIGALGLTSGMTLEMKYEETMKAVQHQYGEGEP